MTDAKKTGMTLGALVTAVILVGTAWPTIERVLNWMTPILAYPAVQAVAVGWAVGAFTLPLPWVLPKSLAPFWTLTFAAALAFAFAFLAVGLLLYVDGNPAANRGAFVFAFGTGLGTIALNAGLRELFFHVRPCVKPGSLKP